MEYLEWATLMVSIVLLTLGISVWFIMDDDQFIQKAVISLVSLYTAGVLARLGGDEL